MNSVPALYTVTLWSDAGAAYSPPLASGSLSESIPLGGSTIIETADTSSAHNFSLDFIPPANCERRGPGGFR